MATYFPPKINTQYIFYASLVSQANTKVMQSNPTIASGDFKVSIDGGALANLATLPAVTPASSVMVKFTLSTSEMNGANITVVCIDAAGAEWCDAVFNIQTTARQIDDLAYPATSGRSMVVDANGLVDANAVKLGPTGSGTAQTARDVGASVLLSSGTGTGQVKLASGYIAPNWGDVGNQSTSVNLSATTTNLVNTVTTYTGNTVQTGDSFARIGVAGVGLTNLGDARIANLDATVSSRSTLTQTQVTGGAYALNSASFSYNAALDFTTTEKTSLNAATPAVTVSDKTGFSLSAAGIQAIWDALTSALTSVGSVGKLLVDNINATISSRLASASYTAPDNTSITGIKAKTDSLTFTVAGQVDANAESMNATTINGTGTSGDLWRGA